MGEAWAARPSPAQDLSALIGEDGTSDIGWVREAYSHEAASLMRRRLYACVAIPVGFLGIATGLEIHRAPELGPALAGAYAIQVLACGLCALVARTREAPRSLEILALATLAVLLATMGFTSGLVGLSPQSFALALVCTLNGVAILLPWSGWNQAAAAALALAVFAGFLHRFAPGI